MTQSITRARALELAQDAIRARMQPLAFDANVALNSSSATPMMIRRGELYAELAAALAFIENMARQKELL